MHTNIPFFALILEKTVLNKLFPLQMKMNIPLLFLFTCSCVYLVHCNVKQSVRMNFPPFLSLFHKKTQSLLHNVLQAIHFAAMHEMWATANASTDHAKTLEWGVQQAQVVLKEFSDGKWREKCPAGLLKNVVR